MGEEIKLKSLEEITEMLVDMTKVFPDEAIHIANYIKSHKQALADAKRDIGVIGGRILMRGTTKEELLNAVREAIQKISDLKGE